MSRRPLALALAAAALAGGCSTYDDYGYGGVSVGYGDGYGYDGGYYDDGYYDGHYDPWWNSYGSYYRQRPYWGWYNGFYYPGTGFYIYDRWRRPIRWNDNHRSYWSGRHGYWRGRGDWRGDRREFRDNWWDFRRDRRRRYR